MIEKAIKLLRGIILNPDVLEEPETFDSLLIIFGLIQDYDQQDDIIDFVKEHYTTEQIIARCRSAVIDAFGCDYRDFVAGKEARDEADRRATENVS